MDPAVLDAEQEAQDALFYLCESEYQSTLESIATLPDLDRFRAEYEKMHKAVLRSRHHAMVVARQHSELAVEMRSNTDVLDEAGRVAVGDALVIRNLKDQCASAEEVIEAGNRNEENLREELRQLRLDIASLSSQLKQGVGLSVQQERTLNELIATKDSLARELDAEFDKIVALRNNLTEVSDKIRITEQLKGDAEHKIYDLKERNAAKKLEIDSEMRNKERLERDLRELRIVVAVKSQEVRVKQEAVNRATDDISILESQIKTQKQMVEKLIKGREALISRTAKLEVECREQIAQTTLLIQDNQEMSKELKGREETLSKNRLEVKKVNRVKEALLKKNKALEQQRVEAEHERHDLKIANDSKAAEIETCKRAIDAARKSVDDLSREDDILLGNALKTTEATAKHVDAAVLLRQSRHNLEVELARENKEVARQLADISRMEAERDHCIQEAHRIQELCVQDLQSIKVKEIEIFEYKKKMIQADTKLKHKQNLYEAVQSDRNLHAKHLIESQADISEMKRKLKIMNYQINGYKEDINSKYEALAKEDAENMKLVKDIEIISDEVTTLKNQNELAQSYIRSQLQEEMKLNQFVKEADLERSRQENALQILISERDNLSAQLIRQNDELSKAYDKIKTQQSSLIRSENHYKEKLKKMSTLRAEITNLHKQDQLLSLELSDTPQQKILARKLTMDITREKTRIKALQDQIDRIPINVHRWRTLEGNNPKAFEMIQLLHTLQKNLISKTKEVQEKEGFIQSKEQLYLHLKGVLAKQVGPEAIEQVEEFSRIYKEKRGQLKHMNVELNMYHAQVREYKHALDVLNRSLAQLKEDYFESKKAGKGQGWLPKLPVPANKEGPVGADAGRVSSSTPQLPPISMISNSIVAAAADAPVTSDGMSVTEMTTNTGHIPIPSTDEYASEFHLVESEERFLDDAITDVDEAAPVTALENFSPEAPEAVPENISNFSNEQAEENLSDNRETQESPNLNEVKSTEQQESPEQEENMSSNLVQNDSNDMLENSPAENSENNAEGLALDHAQTDEQNPLAEQAEVNDTLADILATDPPIDDIKSNNENEKEG